MSDHPFLATAGLPERPRVLTARAAAVPGMLPPFGTWKIDRRPGARGVLPRRWPEPPALRGSLPPERRACAR
jgi:hypothetical protein